MWASIVLAASAGFGAGAALFGVVALGLPVGLWWLAHAQIHGHVQVFGWAGLMVLGVGLHFLPRLRGAPNVPLRPVRWAFWLLVGGLTLRALAQPPLAVGRTGLVDDLARWLTIASGGLELAGVAVVLGTLVGVARRAPPIRQRSGFAQAAPFLITAFGGLVLALLLNFLSLVLTLDGSRLASPLWQQASVDVGLQAFLVPVGLAMSIRIFPLFVRLQFPHLTTLLVGVELAVAGTLAEIVGRAAGIGLLEAVGLVGVGAGCMAGVFGIRVLEPRRQLPRQTVRVLTSPAQLHAISAFVWLAVAGLLLVALGLGRGAGLQVPFSPDPIRHAIGAGYITLLIFGVGADLLPSFAAGVIVSQRLVWATLLLGNLAAALRVLPGLLPLPGSGAMSTAGVLGLAAIVCFGTNLWLSVRGPGRKWAT